MDTNPICHLSPAKKMKCLFLDYVQLLMIGQAGQRTPTPSVTPLQPKKWNACFCIMVNFWWSARLVDELESHLPPLSSQNNEMLIFGLCWTSDSRLGWSMDSNPIHHLSPAKEWNAHFWITFNFWWSAGLVDGLEPHLQPLFNQKMKCLFLYYVIVQIISWAGWWTQSPSTTPQAKKWNANFCITFNFWWLAGLVDGLEPHPLPFSSQKKWNAHFCITFNFWWLARLVIGLEPHPPPVSSQKKWNAHFWITFNFWWSAGLVDELESHLPPLSSQKNEVLIFGLCSTSDDWPGWSMDSNPIHHLSPAKEWNAHFWITFNFWWSAGLVDELESHLPPLSSQKNEMLIFGLLSISGDHPGWSMDSNAIHHPSPAKEWNANF